MNTPIPTCPHPPGTWQYHNWWLIQNAATVSQEVQRIDYERKTRAECEKIKWGHDFDRDYRCACGMSRHEYLETEPEKRTPCPKAKVPA